jgi:hypothetical protein
MKKLVLAALLTHSLVAQAYNYLDWDHPSKPFDSTSKIRTSVKVEWISVDDVRKSCSDESQRRGYPAINFSIEGCSFPGNNVCTIYTPKVTSMHTLGHEMRHCFQGAWHGNKIN